MVALKQGNLFHEISLLADINSESQLALRDFYHFGLCGKESWSSWSLVMLDLSWHWNRRESISLLNNEWVDVEIYLAVQSNLQCHFKAWSDEEQPLQAIRQGVLSETMFMKFGQDAVTSTALLERRTTWFLIDHKLSKAKNSFANNIRCINWSSITSELCIITNTMFPVVTRAAKQVWVMRNTAQQVSSSLGLPFHTHHITAGLCWEFRGSLRCKMEGQKI